ncbi:protein NirV [Desulfosarcina ovata subsp. sediminis]|uniref:Protein NirV n=1 Tax=Desulfosarcina ovata subsp. sediminis TaxID=885957 RepID=A0A5K7ZUM2_9BACT|nr:SUMF1/EgtB/PvdO family nonheme iron enzyme [Desulfosarcina ovata]BBO83874.1 protein NirV [Desulfosarcina ovata subsp. sediminis]
MLTFSASVESDETVKIIDAPNRLERQTESMVEIPAGPFKFGEKPVDAQIDDPFWIDLYLVTNARFKEFIEAGGYEIEAWWLPEGWNWREKERIFRPLYWEDTKWNADDHPVVGVSWYEANAFCNWLGASPKDDYIYHLPDEKQWERAARGTDGRIYPWGDEFDSARCNTEESGIGKTTRIDRYADGLSPDGCYDMAGNVLEWTSTFLDNSKDAYVIKGSSWFNTAKLARCAARDDYSPVNRSGAVGFRCARTKK